MGEDSTQARRTLYLWALGLNVVAWGGYLVLTKVMGIDFESTSAAKTAWQAHEGQFTPDQENRPAKDL